MPDPSRAREPEGVPDVRATSPSGRAPGWREVLALAAVVLGVVFGLWFLTSRIPLLEAIFLEVPTTIVVLVVGTAVVLALALRRRPGG